MQKFNDGLDMSGEGDGSVRDSFKVSNLYNWSYSQKEETLKKTEIEDNKFRFRYAEFEVLLKYSREGRNTEYVSQ